MKVPSHGRRRGGKPPWVSGYILQIFCLLIYLLLFLALNSHVKEVREQLLSRRKLQEFQKAVHYKAFVNTSQEPMVGPVVDDEYVSLPIQMGLVHDHPNVSVPHTFYSTDGFMGNDGFIFQRYIQEGLPRRQGSQLLGILEGLPMALLRQNQGSFHLSLVQLGLA